MDVDAGGELAQQMQQLYVWVIDQTMQVASSFDLDDLEVLERITKDQLNSWIILSNGAAATGSAPTSVGEAARV